MITMNVVKDLLEARDAYHVHLMPTQTLWRRRWDFIAYARKDSCRMNIRNAMGRTPHVREFRDSSRLVAVCAGIRAELGR